MIFFPQLLDSAENWIKFFNSSDNKILDYRNVYLLYPRNFGNSDQHDSFYTEDMANDVVRFMYNHKISTATVGGHGLGAKVALAAACYHSDRFTGFYGIDYTPVDYRYYEPFREIATYVQEMSKLNLKKPRSAIMADIERRIPCPKWKAIFKQNLKMITPANYDWNFNMNGLLENISHSGANHIGAWNPNFGLWGGRCCFVFPEYSRWVHLGTNTLPMHKVCMKVRGYSHDIFSVQGDESPLNHWVYEHSDLSNVVGTKLENFVSMYDGVHTLLSDRYNMGKEFIPDRINTRNNSAFSYTDYVPAHNHHNWRFRKDSQ